MAMTTFSATIDTRLDDALESLRVRLGKQNKAEVFRAAVALLKLAQDGKDEGKKLMLGNTEVVL